MEKAGIDTSVFKAHLARGAAVTAAANVGTTTEDIVKAADWSSDTGVQEVLLQTHKGCQVWANYAYHKG